MLIVGAKGFASEILIVLENNNYSEEIFFYDDVNKYEEHIVLGKQLITTKNQIENKLTKDQKDLFQVLNCKFNVKELYPYDLTEKEIACIALNLALVAVWIYDKPKPRR